MTPFYWQQKLPDNREYIKYKNGFKNNLMYKEIFNQPFFENSNRHMNEGLTLLIAKSENR